MSTTTTTEGPLIRVAAGAAYLGISPRTFYSWLSRGVLPQEATVRCGRAVWLRREVLREWAVGNRHVQPLRRQEPLDPPPAPVR